MNKNDKQLHRKISKAMKIVESKRQEIVVKTYWDLKYGCEVKVLESHQEPYRTRPTGYEEY